MNGICFLLFPLIRISLSSLSDFSLENGLSQMKIEVPLCNNENKLFFVNTSLMNIEAMYGTMFANSPRTWNFLEDNMLSLGFDCLIGFVPILFNNECHHYFIPETIPFTKEKHFVEDENGGCTRAISRGVNLFRMFEESKGRVISSNVKNRNMNIVDFYQLCELVGVNEALPSLNYFEKNCTNSFFYNDYRFSPQIHQSNGFDILDVHLLKVDNSSDSFVFILRLFGIDELKLISTNLTYYDKNVFFEKDERKGYPNHDLRDLTAEEFFIYKSLGCVDTKNESINFPCFIYSFKVNSSSYSNEQSIPLPNEFFRFEVEVVHNRTFILSDDDEEEQIQDSSNTTEIAVKRRVEFGVSSFITEYNCSGMEFPWQATYNKSLDNPYNDNSGGLDVFSISTLYDSWADSYFFNYGLKEVMLLGNAFGEEIDLRESFFVEFLEFYTDLHARKDDEEVSLSSISFFVGLIPGESKPLPLIQDFIFETFFRKVAIQDFRFQMIPKCGYYCGCPYSNEFVVMMKNNQTNQSDVWIDEEKINCFQDDPNTFSSEDFLPFFCANDVYQEDVDLSTSCEFTPLNPSSLICFDAFIRLLPSEKQMALYEKYSKPDYNFMNDGEETGSCNTFYGFILQFQNYGMFNVASSFPYGEYLVETHAKMEFVPSNSTGPHSVFTTLSSISRRTFNQYSVFRNNETSNLYLPHHYKKRNGDTIFVIISSLIFVGTSASVTIASFMILIPSGVTAFGSALKGGHSAASTVTAARGSSPMSYSNHFSAKEDIPLLFGKFVETEKNEKIRLVDLSFKHFNKNLKVSFSSENASSIISSTTRSPFSSSSTPPTLLNKECTNLKDIIRSSKYSVFAHCKFCYLEQQEFIRYIENGHNEWTYNGIVENDDNDPIKGYSFDLNCVKCGMPLMNYLGFETKEQFCVICSVFNKFDSLNHGRCLLHSASEKKKTCGSPYVLYQQRFAVSSASKKKKKTKHYDRFLYLMGEKEENGNFFYGDRIWKLNNIMKYEYVKGIFPLIGLELFHPFVTEETLTLMKKVVVYFKRRKKEILKEVVFHYPVKIQMNEMPEELRNLFYNHIALLFDRAVKTIVIHLKMYRAFRLQLEKEKRNSNNRNHLIGKKRKRETTSSPNYGNSNFSIEEERERMERERRRMEEKEQEGQPPTKRRKRSNHDNNNNNTNNGCGKDIEMISLNISLDHLKMNNDNDSGFNQQYSMEQQADKTLTIDISDGLNSSTSSIRSNISSLSIKSLSSSYTNQTNSLDFFSHNDGMNDERYSLSSSSFHMMNEDDQSDGLQSEPNSLEKVGSHYHRKKKSFPEELNELEMMNEEFGVDVGWMDEDENSPFGSFLSKSGSDEWNL